MAVRIAIVAGAVSLFHPRAVAQPAPDYCYNYPPSPVVGQWQSAKVFYDTQGKLVYTVDAEQNRIPDFSYAGYHYGEIEPPVVPVKTTMGPAAGDRTAALQAALDAIGDMPADANGHRGALLLLPGTYEIWGTLRVRDNGVVLRGSGDGTNPAVDTILFGRGNTPNQRTVVILGTNDGDPWDNGTPVNITDDFVPVGSMSFNVASVASFSVGQHVEIRHPSSQAWINAVDGGGMVNSADWSAGSIDMRWIRRITKIEGTKVFLDAPIYDHLNKSLTQSTIAPITNRNLITEAGIEDLRVDIETAGGDDEAHASNCIGVVGADNCWVRNISARYFKYAGVRTNGAIRISIIDCRATDPVAVRTGGNMYNFASDSYSQLNLFTRCHAGQGRHSYVSNGTSTASGVVVHRCTMAGGDFELHRRWSQGFLCDNLRETGSTNSQAKLINRGDFGTSHGWGATHSVIWKFNKETTVQKPPTGQNYAVCTEGTFRNSGWFPGPMGSRERQSGELVPDSLYEAQLCERLGGGAAPVPGLSVSATPTSRIAGAGTSAIYSIQVTQQLLPPGSAVLSATGLPSGATATFDPPFGPGSSTLTVETGSASPPGVYNMVVSADKLGTHAETTVRLSLLPEKWASQDIGAVAMAGDASYAGGVFSLVGGGSDIWGSADQFHYTHRAANGDLTITARVASQQNTNAWAKCGVMIRESTAANSKFVGVYVTPGNGVSMQYRPATGAVDHARVPGLAAPRWVRLVRTGNSFAGFHSADGVTWTAVGSPVPVTMGAGVLAGLADCSHNASQTNATTFSNVSVEVNSEQLAASREWLILVD